MFFNLFKNEYLFSKEKSKISLSESDKLNGNNELEAEKAGQDASAAPASSATAPVSKQADGGPASPGVVLRKKPVCAAAKQPAARASMSSIIKGSVMDKVTHVFNNGVTMGNANNSANKKAAELPTAASSGPDLPISPVTTTESEKSGGINIPKGKYFKQVVNLTHTVEFHGKYGQFRSQNGTIQFWTFPVKF